MSSSINSEHKAGWCVSNESQSRLLLKELYMEGGGQGSAPPPQPQMVKSVEESPVGFN